MSNLQYISVAGYGSTGSSAVVDLLAEVNSTLVLGGEFRFIQDPDGLEDLCFNLSNAWGWVRSDAYIRRFLKYTNIIGRRAKFYQFGNRLNETFNGSFFKYRDEFLNEIIDSTWKGYWFYHDYHERGCFSTFIEKLKRYSKKFGVSKKQIRKMTKKSDMYFVRSDIDCYTPAKKFIENLFKEYSGNSGKKNIVLDQLLLPYNRNKFLPLFDDIKQIVVDRDPRDVYLDAMTYNAYPITDDINTFISFYESSRALANNKDGNVLFLQFEDLIYNYDSVVEEIFSFLSIPKNEHTLSKSRFKPNMSIKNTQTWKRPEFKHLSSEISIIEKKLHRYCYEFN